MGQDGGEALTGIDASTALGGAGGASVPANVAALIHKRTARGGRRGRGRMYLPWWIQESDVDERGAISSTTIGFMNTALATWLADLAADGCPMVVLHDPGRTPAGAPDVVTSLTVDPIVGTQRRRLGR
jgi:hypothetical protein